MQALMFKKEAVSINLFIFRAQRNKTYVDTSYNAVNLDRISTSGCDWESCDYKL